MRDVQAFLFLAAILLALPAFLLRLAEPTRLLCRVLCYVAFAAMMSTAGGMSHGAARWIYWACSLVWWLSTTSCWQRLERARADERRRAIALAALRNRYR